MWFSLIVIGECRYSIVFPSSAISIIFFIFRFPTCNKHKYIFNLFVYFKLELESWDSWGQDEDRNAQNHAKQHGHLYGRQNSNDQEEEDIDYFSDMTPRFKKATKVR